jgi:hypothetical protein
VIKLGAGLLGYVAGEMLLSDPVLDAYDQIAIVHVLIPWVGALLVIGIGSWVAARINAKRRRQSAVAAGENRQ